MPNATDRHTYKWPSLGIFLLKAADSSRYQTTLKIVADGTPVSPIGTQVVAQLHTGSNNFESWKPVEVCVHGERVGFYRVVMPAAFSAARLTRGTPNKPPVAMPSSLSVAAVMTFG